MKRERTLKNHILLWPSLILLASLLLVLLVFDYATDRYIQRTIAQQIENEIAAIDAYYADRFDRNIPEEDAESPIIPVYYAILNARQEMIDPHKEWSNEQERRRSQSIIDSMENMTEGSHKVSTANATYYVTVKQYIGTYDNFLIVDIGEEVYTVLVYSNISSIQELLNLVNRMLLVLLVLAGLFSLLTLFGMVRRIDKSMHKLEGYLQKVGDRESLTVLETLPYKEFNCMAQSVQHMSKRIDRAEQNQKTFFQNASHELRTPLMSIQGYAEGLDAGVVKNQKKAYEIIRKESDKMSRLVDEILFLSKMDTKTLHIEKELFDCKELLYDTSWQIHSLAKQQGIVITHHLPAEPVFIRASYELMERAVLNILTNALRYAKSAITLTCSVEKTNVRISIANDGEEIAAQDIPHVFDRFFKGEKGQFGIGLAITSDIMKEHNGSISVQSQTGETMFTMQIPL